MQLDSHQQECLAHWRRDVQARDRAPSEAWLEEVERQIAEWPKVRALADGDRAFERLAVVDAAGQRNGASVWRRVAHWLGIRHESVQGAVFTSQRLLVVQRRSDAVEDSPGLLDLSFAGHVGQRPIDQALADEAGEELGLDIANAVVERIAEYEYVDSGRPAEIFYNCEYRILTALRAEDAAIGRMNPTDGEVAHFLLVPLAEALLLAGSDQAASALAISGPMALKHARRAWGWKP